MNRTNARSRRLMIAITATLLWAAGCAQQADDVTDSTSGATRPTAEQPAARSPSDSASMPGGSAQAPALANATNVTEPKDEKLDCSTAAEGENICTTCKDPATAEVVSRRCEPVADQPKCTEEVIDDLTCRSCVYPKDGSTTYGCKSSRLRDVKLACTRAVAMGLDCHTCTDQEGRTVSRNCHIDVPPPACTDEEVDGQTCTTCRNAKGEIIASGCSRKSSPKK